MTKKLTLDIEALVVEQFEVDAADAKTRGSVRGHGETVTSPCICPDMPATMYYFDTDCCTG